MLSISFLNVNKITLKKGITKLIMILKQTIYIIMIVFNYSYITFSTLVTSQKMQMRISNSV